ncbi:TPA: hypothetical protein QDZ75_000933 [Stenotrophomonas maltophilia]|jgi:hypothetical protein|uniref:Lipoprotein n=1 Tax=Stenotrophomonas maltophilia TaxID=40324 RepID=A0A2J0U7F8_STEMA|nr:MULTISPECIES: hypothetical protein [Stenotrophomonas]PJL25262.1 hypothetical protein B9Y64_17220 [Stenotrophomonas maltophilia]HDS1136927.1 hypothetical protein [Stenotrophomonas maltophilia]HDS1146605.1 hypothetical protein [Stenotrophomonas maltophilia]HDS1162462.1 hypothetical protein [Stenotrophomonas maltophilia]HEL5402717.1 hypothetical protein [Stenotrophomonas maltophilia]
MCRYRPAALLMLACGVALVACTPAPQATPAGTAPATAAPPRAAPATTAATVEPTAVHARSECPYPEFDAFLKHFGNEITLQEKATADPLLDSYIDAEAEPEPRKVESRLALADVEWPVMPDPSTLAGQGREMQVSTLADGQRQVQIRTPDSSDQQTYTFAQTPCWTLVKREDESI